MLWEFVDKNKLRRALLYFAYMFVVLILQSVLFSRIAPLGVKAMFIPAAVVAVGLFDGSVWGVGFGLALGFLADINYDNTALFIILFPILGFFSGVLSRWYVNKTFFAYMIISAGALAITAFCQLFRLLFFLEQDAAALFTTALIQVLWSIPLSAPLYAPVKAISEA